VEKSKIETITKNYEEFWIEVGKQTVNIVYPGTYEIKEKKKTFIDRLKATWAAFNEN